VLVQECETKTGILANARESEWAQDMTETANAVNAVRMSGIKKSFGGVRALKGVDLFVKAGSVHALVGGNGAGKSTVLKILCGVHAPDEGEISIFGVPMRVHTSDAARRLGVAMIFQELSLIPTLTVAQNIFLTREPRRAGVLVDTREANQQAQRLLGALGENIDPRTPVRRLSPGQAQITEIAKAISQKARVLIMDEPTSALSTTEVTKLFAFLRRITAQGVAVIYVSHRMDEISEVAEEVTIFRDGQRIVTAFLRDLTLDQIVEYMVGKRVHNFTWKPRQVDRSQEPMLETRSLSGRGKPIDVSFRLFRGEVLGIAGLLGSGRSELARLLFGIDPIVSGEILVRGKPITITSPRSAIKAGIALIPESRQREGLIVAQSVVANLSLPRIDGLSRGPFLDKSSQTAMATELVKRLLVKTASLNVAVRTLSGGNQQKLVLGKWLAMEPEIIILDEPTAGVDIGSKSEIIELIRSLADSGKSIIIISSEPAELLAASDRILIMNDGRLARELGRNEINKWAVPDAESDDESTHQLEQSEHGLQVAIQEVRQNAGREH
jgi:ribose transport system ATP-binding protein